MQPKKESVKHNRMPCKMSDIRVLKDPYTDDNKYCHFYIFGSFDNNECWYFNDIQNYIQNESADTDKNLVNMLKLTKTMKKILESVEVQDAVEDAAMVKVFYKIQKNDAKQIKTNIHKTKEPKIG